MIRRIEYHIWRWLEENNLSAEHRDRVWFAHIDAWTDLEELRQGLIIKQAAAWAG